MRNTRWMLAAFAAGTMGLASTAAAQSGKVPSKLQDDLQKLHAADQGEVKAGQFAESAASSSDVKAFAQKMVTDHTQNDQQLSSLAGSLGVSLEGGAFQKEQKDAQDSMKKFQGKSGSEFDKAYIDQMVKDHEKDAKDVKKMAENAHKDGQGDIAALLTSTHQAIESHLAMAKQLQSSLKNNTPSASAPSSSTTGTGSSTGTSTDNANQGSSTDNSNQSGTTDNSGKKGY